MTVPTYPAVITFALAPESLYRLAMETVAQKMRLPLVVTESGVIEITVSGPGEAFQFGEEVQVYLEAMRP